MIGTVNGVLRCSCGPNPFWRSQHRVTAVKTCILAVLLWVGTSLGWCQGAKPPVKYAIMGLAHDHVNGFSSLELNLIVAEILDAARLSAQSGRRVDLPADGAE
jgi:hypothetical protein